MMAAAPAGSSARLLQIIAGALTALGGGELEPVEMAELVARDAAGVVGGDAVIWLSGFGRARSRRPVRRPPTGWRRWPSWPACRVPATATAVVTACTVDACPEWD